MHREQTGWLGCTIGAIAIGPNPPRRMSARWKVVLVVLGLLTSSCTACKLQNDGEELAATTARESSGKSSRCVGEGERPEDSIEGTILRLVNDQRRAAGIGPLCYSRRLAEIAREHSRKMAQLESFAHRVAEELSPLERIISNGVPVDRVAENIFATDETPANGLAEDCVAMWMGSDEHRTNILSAQLDYTGVAIFPSGAGIFYITEDFAHLRDR